MHNVHRSFTVTALFLFACESTPQITSTSGSAAATVSASATTPSPASSPTPASASSAAVSAPAPTASASVAAGAAASPCPEGARKDDKLRYCITLPPNPLALTYEGDDPKKGIREELEAAGSRIIIEVGPMLPGATVATLKESALKVNGQAVFESGDMKGGFWMHLKSGGQNTLRSVVISGSYQVICTFEVGDEKQLETGRAVIKSLMAF